MIQDNLLLILSLMFVVFIFVMAGQKLKISYPVFLVMGGLIISLIPEIPVIKVDPQMIFLIFLPPLLYEAAWFTSWHDFWRWKRPILLLAFGLVIFTSSVVAFLTSSMIPGFTLALGFLLGGIISPPDAVSATTILKSVKIPKRAVTILEGESLINDASSLIVFRFATAAVVTGIFVPYQAATDFVLVAVMGVVVGLTGAFIIYSVHRYLPTTASIDAALTLMTPYLLYVAAEHFHFSGVIAVVSGGLFLSFRSHEILNFRSRLQATGVWTTLTFILNGLIFILIGLELPVIVDELGEYSISEAIFYGLIVSVAVVAVRLIWMFPSAFIPRLLSKKIRKRERSPGWKGPMLLGFAGMRGVVSLASALSIPLVISSGEPFPLRNLIMFITFVVILFTLVVQGIMLPFIIKILKIEEIDELVPEEEQETALRIKMMQTALERLELKYKKDIEENDLVKNLQHDLESNISISSQRLNSLICDEQELKICNNILKDLITVQRKKLFQLRKQNAFDDVILRRQEAQLDLNEAKISKEDH